MKGLRMDGHVTRGLASSLGRNRHVPCRNVFHISWHGDVRQGEAATQREVPSYVTAACSSEFISCPYRTQSAFQNNLHVWPVLTFDGHICCSQLLCSSKSSTDLREKYRNLNWGPYIVLLLEIEMANFPVFRTAKSLNEIIDMLEMFKLILCLIMALIF